MIRVDDEFMSEVGLDDMPASEKKAFMAGAEEELEIRVGSTIAERLTSEQVAEFSQIEDDGAALNWLNERVPDFRDLVLKTFHDFKQEIMAGREQILA